MQQVIQFVKCKRENIKASQTIEHDGKGKAVLGTTVAEVE